jgi:hypothetical protein
MNTPTQTPATKPVADPSKGPAGYSQARPKDPLMTPPAGKNPTRDAAKDATTKDKDEAITQPANRE